MKNLKVCCKSCVYAVLGEYNNAYCNNPNRPEGIEFDEAGNMWMDASEFF